MLSLKNVTKKFSSPTGGVVALDNVSMDITPGELLAIRGPSGCGKSTLLLTAAGLLKPDKGEVVYDGKTHIYDLSPGQRCSLRAKTVGFVFQQYHLIPYLTVRENIATPGLTSAQEITGVRVGKLLEQFNLADRAEHVPAQLSTGQRQRTALVRALFNNPGIIMADEPTGNLDEQNARIVLEHLKIYVSNGGSVLLVTHDRQAAEYATRTLEMKDGRLL